MVVQGFKILILETIILKYQLDSVISPDTVMRTRMRRALDDAKLAAMIWLETGKG